MLTSLYPLQMIILLGLYMLWNKFCVHSLCHRCSKNITTKKSSEPLHFEIVPRIRRLPALLLGHRLLAVGPVRVDIGRLLCAGPRNRCIIRVKIQTLQMCRIHLGTGILVLLLRWLAPAPTGALPEPPPGKLLCLVTRLNLWLSGIALTFWLMGPENVK